MIYVCQFINSIQQQQNQPTYILLHAQECLPRLVLAVAHIAELLEVFFGCLLGMLAAEAWGSALLAAALKLEVVICLSQLQLDNRLRPQVDVPPQWQTYALSSVVSFSASS